MKTIELDAAQLLRTLQTLRLRIFERFPDSGLHNVSLQLIEVAKQSRKTVEKIGNPIWSIRLVAISTIVAMISFAAWLSLSLRHESVLTFEDAIPIAEAGMNLLILLAIAIYWLWNSEVQMRRAKVVAAVNQLREFSHVIDMHQLTKDPDSAFLRSQPTEHSPKRKMTPYELSRYLDYCSEMLSLISKLGYLYVSKLHDAAANQSVVELESLCSGLSRKIWQKIMVIYNLASNDPEKLLPTAPLPTAPSPTAEFAPPAQTLDQPDPKEDDAT